VADLPDRSVHGYRISQLLSSRVDPGEIPHEYRTTRFPERFYSLKIGIPWTDQRYRVDDGVRRGMVGRRNPEEPGLLCGRHGLGARKRAIIGHLRVTGCRWSEGSQGREYFDILFCGRRRAAAVNWPPIRPDQARS
jgi:hypothetical protein